MKHGSLFSGIGGFDLAAQWMGWENVFHCEINPFGQQVLKHYWPDAISYDDIKTTDFSIHRGCIDVLSGGFPCQPYSTAGKRLGKEDARHLWPEMLRAIREISPRWIVGENVRGLTNWNGGVVFDEVQADLEAEGYEVLPFLLPACGVDAPHQRDRIWFIAYADRTRILHNNSETLYHEYRNDSSEVQRSSKQPGRTSDFSDERIIAHTDVSRLQGREKEKMWQYPAYGDAWDQFPTQSPVRSGDDGISSGLDGITFSKWRTESIKAAGNAVVPQLVLQLFKAIEEYDRHPHELFNLSGKE